jgi:hypothetical protein
MAVDVASNLQLADFRGERENSLPRRFEIEPPLQIISVVKYLSLNNDYKGRNIKAEAGI